MRKRTVLLLIILLMAHYSHAQNVHIDSLIVQGKEQIQGAVDSWDIGRLVGARGFFERLLNDPTYPWLVRYYLGFTDNRIVTYYLKQDNKEKVKEFLEDGIAHLEKVIEIKSDFAEGYALLSSLLGYKIALNPLLGMTLGMKSGSMLQKAFDLAPENPRVSLIVGQSAYYTPKMFGGGKDKALEHIKKAVECFETFKVEKPILPTWGYDEAYAYLGMIQMEQGDLDEAKISFERALEINPDNGWIKFVLMRQLEEKTAKRDKE